jgi:hypothetical protein
MRLLPHRCSMLFGTTSFAESRTRRVSRVYPRTRPKPVFRTGAETCLYRVSCNVSGDSLFAGSVANPAVEMVSRPKALAPPIQQPIGLARAASLDRCDNRTQPGVGPQNNVKVIRHQNPGAEIVLSGSLPFEQDLHDGFGHLWQLKPARSRGDRIEQAVRHCEPCTFGSPSISDYADWERSGKTPCQEVRSSFALPVRKTAVEFRHARMVAGTIWIIQRRTRLAPRVRDTRVEEDLQQIEPAVPYYSPLVAGTIWIIQRRTRLAPRVRDTRVEQDLQQLEPARSRRTRLTPRVQGPGEVSHGG